MYHKRKLLIALSNKIEFNNPGKAIEQMWNEELLDIKALERLYINTEIERRVRAGEGKARAIEQLSIELDCSYEKVRAAAYYKKHKLKKNENTN